MGASVSQAYAERTNQRLQVNMKTQVDVPRLTRYQGLYDPTTRRQRERQKQQKV